MRNMSVVLLLLSAISVVVLFVALRSIPHSIAKDVPETQKVVVAIRDIDTGDHLTNYNVVVKEVDVDTETGYLHPSELPLPDLVARTEIEVGTIIELDHLMMYPPSINNGSLRPGDKVVSLNLRKTRGESAQLRERWPHIRANVVIQSSYGNQTILKNVRVFSIDLMSESGSDSDGEIIISVLVSTDDMKKITAAWSEDLVVFAELCNPVN